MKNTPNMKRITRQLQRCTALVVGILLTAPCVSVATPPDNVLKLSLEELMDVEVYSASKKEESLQGTASAVFVLTSEDIKRSGATSIPEALRLVPGVQVAKINGNEWAITIRGFNGRFANKLLVLVDGRSVYTPIFSGVYWNELDMLMDDIERIEVVRGPGGTLWGANAVNGIINIITRRAKDTKGGLITGRVGANAPRTVGARFGGAVGEDGHVSVYAKHYNRPTGDGIGGDPAFDSANTGQGGIKSDWKLSDSDNLTVQGDIYSGHEQGLFKTPAIDAPGSGFIKSVMDHADTLGANILTHWSSDLSKDSHLDLTAYYSRHERHDFLADLTVNTYNVELQHRFKLEEIHDIVWGVGYRGIKDNIGNGELVSFSPRTTTSNLLSGFAQDQISMFDEKAKLIVGSKIEHNDFTGTEVQPSIRLAYTPTSQHTFWTSVSRAVRTSTRLEEDVSALFGTAATPGGAVYLAGVGNDQFQSEELVAYEAGYRYAPLSWMNIDISSFYGDYSKLATLEPSETSFGFVNGAPATIFTWRNNASGKSSGVESVVNIQPTDNWRLQLWYAYLDLSVKVDSGTTDILSASEPGDIPHQEAMIRSLWSISDSLNLDGALRYVDRLPGTNIHEYFELDLRLGWHPRPDFELALVGQNLLHEDHKEFSETFPSTAPTAAERATFVKATFTF